MISGSIVALVTPMFEDGSIDWESLDALAEWHVDSGTAAIVPVGTTGESATIAVPEHCKIVKRVVEQVKGRIPVIAGTGANATKEAIELTAAAKDAGADACLLVTPYYNKPTQEGLFRHYEAIAAAVDIPQVLYNVPGRTACDMLPETVKRLSAIEQVVAIKEATGDLARTLKILELCGTDMVIYSGDDATACDLMLNGAKGTISVTANVAPSQMAAMCDAAVAGKADEAHDLDELLLGLHAGLFLESNPIPVKWALMEMGKINKGIRLPLTELASEYHQSVRLAMRQAGVLS
jgi:4-hydroxy-tetrahydrodipicolinate synthase